MVKTGQVIELEHKDNPITSHITRACKQHRVCGSSRFEKVLAFQDILAAVVGLNLCFHLRSAHIMCFSLDELTWYCPSSRIFRTLPCLRSPSATVNTILFTIGKKDSLCVNFTLSPTWNLDMIADE